MVTKSDKIAELVEEVKELPTLPLTVNKLLELLNDPRSQAKFVGEMLASDQTLSARVLNIVNSPLYGLRRPIASVQQAVVVLGFGTIRSIVLGASVIESFRSSGGHDDGYFNPKAFWTHAIGTAAGAQAIARKFKLGRPEDAFTAGLLHSVGLIFLDLHAHEKMKLVQESVKRDGKRLIEAEEEELGFGHATLGAHLLNHWRLPENIVAGVEYHTQVDRAPGDGQLAALVHLGDAFCRSLGYGNPGELRINPINPAALDKLGILPSTFPEILEEVDREIAKATAFLEVASAA